MAMPFASVSAGVLLRQDGRLAPPARVERSKSVNSSLKKVSRTEGEKKVVSFADSMGLDLCQVRPIFPYNTSDEDILSSTPPSSNVKSQNRSRVPPPPASLNCPRYLQLQGSAFPMWRDPAVVQKELTAKAKKDGVTLKSSSVMGMTFSGVVAVANFAFEKRVYVRYSVDDWRTFVDTRCHFLTSNAADQIDLFSFSIYLPPSMPVGARCHFCIRYECAGKEFWDNNEDQNYVLEVRSLGDAFAEREFEQPLFY